MKLGELSGVSWQRIGRWERGERTLLPEETARVAAALGIEDGVVLESSGCLTWRDYPRYFGAGRLGRLHRQPGKSWAAQEEHCQDLLARLSPVAPPPAWVKESKRADVPTEALLLASLWAAGYSARGASPVLLGYEPHALLSESLDALGVAPVACLYLKREGIEVFVFSQVSMLCGESVLRVDLLVGLFCASRSAWCVVELDGSSHHGREKWDRRRDARIRNRVLRFHSSAVMDLQFPERLWECWMEFFEPIRGFRVAR